MNKSALLVEFLLIFVSPPLLIAGGLLPKTAIMPVLWLVSLYAYLLLRRAGVKVLAIDFERKALHEVLKRFFVIAAAITFFLLLYRPELFLALVRTDPWFWLAVMLFYPLFSAFIQEILFRSFFFYRYEKLFQGRHLPVVLNALLFAYVHIVFGNWVAVVFTFFGGLLFAQTYLKSRSLLLTAIEHSLYGDMLYTLGLGYYFYHGANIG